MSVVPKALMQPNLHRFVCAGALALLAQGCAHAPPPPSDPDPYTAALDAHVSARLAEAWSDSGMEVSRHLAVFVLGRFDGEGTLTSAEIARSSGLTELDALALKTVRATPRFGPAPAELGERFERTFRLRARPGPDVVTPKSPSPTHRENPIYPGRAAERGLAGCVRVSFIVGLDGVPTDIVVLDGQPPGVFEATTLKALSQWRFPAVDEPVPSLVTLAYTLDATSKPPKCDPAPSP